MYDCAMEDGQVQFTIALEDVLKLKEPAKKTHTRMKICEKRGTLFFLKMQKKRLAFFCIFFVVLVYASALYQEVWKITIQGNNEVKTEEIEAVLTEQGIVLGCKKNHIDFDACEELLRERFQDFTWVTVYRKGQEIFVLCKENPYKNNGQKDGENAGDSNKKGNQFGQSKIEGQSDAKDDNDLCSQNDSMSQKHSIGQKYPNDFEKLTDTENLSDTENPTVSENKESQISKNLVSSVNGYVDEIFVRSGTAMVKKGDCVVEGQILILGEVDTKDEWAENQENQTSYGVCADGDVILSYTDDFYVSMDYLQQEEIETGRIILIPEIHLFHQEYRFVVEKKLPEIMKLDEKHETNLDILKILCPELEKRLAPKISLLKYNEIAKIEKRYTKEELVESLEGEVVKKLLNLEEKGVQIVQKNVTIESNYKGVTCHCDLLLRKKESQMSEAKYGTVSDDL